MLSHFLRPTGRLEACILASSQLQPEQARVKLFSLRLENLMGLPPGSATLGSRHELWDEENRQILGRAHMSWLWLLLRAENVPETVEDKNSGGLLG